MYDTKGLTYWIWRAAWPALCLLLWLRPGEFGLLFPRRSTTTKEERRWWRDNLYRNTRRVISDGVGGVSATLLGVLSLITAPATWLVTVVAGLRIQFQLLFAFGVTIVVGYTLLVVACYTAYLSLRSLPPKKFAKLALSGRTLTDVLRALSWEIRAACELFEKQTLAFSRVFTPAEIAELRPKRPELSAAIERVRQLSPQLRTNLDIFKAGRLDHVAGLQRLMALKIEAARLLGIPPRRFCDHVVQHSPRLQMGALAKFAANWDYLLSAANRRSLGTNAQYRFMQLLKENERMRLKIHGRIQIQRELFEHNDMHEYVQLMASHPSTSEATLTYARAVSTVAASALSASDKVDYERAERRLKLLYRKQRSHREAEPHQCLLQACKVVSERPELSGTVPSTESREEDSDSIVTMQIRLLESIPGTLRLQGTSSDPATRDETGRRNLAAMRELAFTAEVYFEWSRGRIADNFSKLAAESLGGGALAIVVCGYSKTVRECLKAGLTTAVSTATKSRLGVGVDRPQIFLVSNDEEDFGTQQMLFELREDPTFPNAVVVGSARQIADVLQYCDRVMIVLGLETFGDSGTLTTPRVLHDPFVAEQIDDLVARLDHSGITHDIVFVGGSFKAHHVPLMRQDKFLQFHLRHVSMFRSVCRLVSDLDVVTIRCHNRADRGFRLDEPSPSPTAASVTTQRASGNFVDGVWIPNLS